MLNNGMPSRVAGNRLSSLRKGLLYHKKSLLKLESFKIKCLNISQLLLRTEKQDQNIALCFVDSYVTTETWFQILLPGKPEFPAQAESSSQPTNLLVTFLEYSSIVMQDIKGKFLLKSCLETGCHEDV